MLSWFGMAKWICKHCKTTVEKDKAPTWCSACKKRDPLVLASSLPQQQVTTTVTPMVVSVDFGSAESMMKSLSLPKSENDLTQTYAAKLIALHKLVFGQAGVNLSALESIASGTPANSGHLNDAMVIYKLVKASVTNMANRRSEMQKLVDRAGSSKQNEQIYRDTSQAEVSDLQSKKVLRQAGNTMDKFKWFFWDLSHPPIGEKDVDKRLILTVPKGTVDEIKKISVPHIGSGIEDPIVSRDEKSLTNRGYSVESMTTEPGTFAVHRDVLDIFSKLLRKIDVTDR